MGKASMLKEAISKSARGILCVLVAASLTFVYPAIAYSDTPDTPQASDEASAAPSDDAVDQPAVEEPQADVPSPTDTLPADTPVMSDEGTTTEGEDSAALADAVTDDSPQTTLDASALGTGESADLVPMAAGDPTVSVVKTYVWDATTGAISSVKLDFTVTFTTSGEMSAFRQAHNSSADFAIISVTPDDPASSSVSSTILWSTFRSGYNRNVLSVTAPTMTINLNTTDAQSFTITTQNVNNPSGTDTFGSFTVNDFAPGYDPSGSIPLVHLAYTSTEDISDLVTIVSGASLDAGSIYGVKRTDGSSDLVSLNDIATEPNLLTRSVAGLHTDLQNVVPAGLTLSDYLGISGTTLTAKKATTDIIPIPLTTDIESMILTLHCADDQGHLYAFDVIIDRLHLQVDDSYPGLFYYGEDFLSTVSCAGDNSFSFINTNVHAYAESDPNTQIALDIASLFNHPELLIKSADYDQTSESYPDQGEVLNFELDVSAAEPIDPTSIIIDPTPSTFTATFKPYASFDIPSNIASIDNAGNATPAVKLPGGAILVRSDTIDLGGATPGYKFYTSLGIDGNLNPNTGDEITGINTYQDLYDLQYTALKTIYVKSNTTGEVSVLGKITKDDTYPVLMGFKMLTNPDAQYPENSKNGFLGYSPTGGASAQPVLELTLSDNTEVASYSLTYDHSPFSGSATAPINLVEGTNMTRTTGSGGDDIWTVQVPFPAGDAIYSLTGFELTITDIAGNTVVYCQDTSSYDATNAGEARSWASLHDDVSTGAHFELFKAVILNSHAPVVSYASFNSGVLTTPQDASIYLDSFTVEVLKLTKPGYEIASYTVNGSKTSITAQDFVDSGTAGTMVCVLPFAGLSGDADITVNIDFTDFLGHHFGPINDSFKVDQTAPLVSVEWDNMNAYSGNYYNAPRKATIHVYEKNFSGSPDSVNLDITATDDAGKSMPVPQLSPWLMVAPGEYVATVYFDQELHYTMSCSVTDEAGHTSEPTPKEDFIIDMTAPTISISGLADTQAFSGDIHPVVTFSDAHFDDYSAQVSFTLATGEPTYIFRSSGDYEKTTKTVTVDDVDHTPDNDNVYIMKATVTDRAGNTTTETRMFSINRFGSTYLISPATTSILNTYINKPQDVVVTEINPSGLKSGETIVRMSKNVDVVDTLQAGTDYTVTPGSTNELWDSYVYTIPAARFNSDGHYRIVLRSVDMADNLSENTMDNKNYNRTANADIDFALDTTKPTCSIMNVDTGKTYLTNSYEIQLDIEDNLAWDYAQLFIDGKEVKRYEATGEEQSATFTYVLDKQTTPTIIKLVAYDKAGNLNTAEKADVTINASPLVLVMNTPVLFNGFIVAIIVIFAALVALLVVLLAAKRRRDKRQVVFEDNKGKEPPK